MFDGPRCRIVGVLDDGPASLGVAALAALQQAEVLIGARRTLALFDASFSPEAERRTLGGLSALVDQVREAQARGARVVVLATGDPLCHGIAGYLGMQLCLEAIEVLPNVSTLQLACARVGLVWQDLKICSIHHRDAGEWQLGADARHGLYPLAQAVRAHDRLAVLTSPDNTPARVARLLLAEGLANDFQLAVAERLCQPQERTVSGLSVTEAAVTGFAEPNVLLLWRTAPRPTLPRFGLPDASFEQRQPEKGLITKCEVRAVSLARLQLAEDAVVWDLGAGSGAVGLEAARLCPRGHVYAMEKNDADVAIAARNRAAFGVGNHTLAQGRAPEGLDDWADPDAVFIGGSGGELPALIERCLQRLKPGGRLVMNFVTIENLAAATAALQRLGMVWDVLQLQASRSRPILHMHRLVAENPVWIVCAHKAEAA